MASKPITAVNALTGEQPVQARGRAVLQELAGRWPGPPAPQLDRLPEREGGFIFQPCDAAAKSGDDCKGRWKVHYILLSEAGGGVPLWAADKGVSKAMAAQFAKTFVAFKFSDWKRFAGTLSCGGLGMWGLNRAFCEKDTEELHVSKSDESLLVSILDDAMDNLLSWAKAEPSWWDECRAVRLPAGLKEGRHCRKKLEGFPVRLQMISAVWEDVTLEELVMVTEVSDDCLKLKFVAMMENIQTRRFNDRGCLVRTTIKPVLLGLVSPREVESIMRPPEARDGWVASVGIGLHSPLFIEKVQQSSSLLALAASPPSKGKVRAVDHTSALALILAGESSRWSLRGAVPGHQEAAAAAPAAAAVSVEEGRQRLQDAQKSLEELLADYEQIKKSKSGDVVRTRLKATSSPVSQVQKIGEAVAAAAGDPGAFQDALEEFLAAVTSADSLAYSSGFASSGDPKVQNAGNYLEGARAQIKIAAKDLATMLDALA
ncbi:unnamed protein product [Effrenium voratum]|nr:unnamed protein product [Effrenium voratum]